MDTVGRHLGRSLTAMLEALPAATRGPQAFADELGLDKVLGSRVLKTIRSGDPVATVHRAPGPEPLRRVVAAARLRGVPAAAADAAAAAIDDFDRLIRDDAGDRSALDAILAAWLPEARHAFELRRKQAAWRAMSQLKGATVDTNLGVAILAPAAEPGRIDVIWILGLLGIERLRPGVRIRLSTRRLESGAAPRHPVTLDGQPIESIMDARLDGYGERPSAEVTVDDAGEAVHYLLGGVGFGAASASDFLTAEVNRGEISATVPAGSGRRGFVFASISTPARRVLLDVFVHEDVYPGAEPELVIHDTAVEGVANVNDRSRDIDRLDLDEQVRSLGRGIAGARTSHLPRYAELLRDAFAALDLEPSSFRACRTEVDFPVHGSQISVAFAAPEG